MKSVLFGLSIMAFVVLSIMGLMAGLMLSSLLAVFGAMIGFTQGFNVPLAILVLFFWLLAIGTIKAFYLFVEIEKMLNSLWPHLLSVSVGLGYLALSVLIFWGLSWDEGLAKYYSIYFGCATSLAVNLPFTIFHFLMCFSRNREYLSKKLDEFDGREKESVGKNLELWERINNLPGGDSDPFEAHVGPTSMCLSAHQLVTFIEDGEKDENVIRHLDDCGECLDRVVCYKAVR